MRLSNLCVGVLCSLAVFHTAVAADVVRQPTLAEIYTTLASKRFVDLTHSFGPATPHWKGFGEMKVRTLYTIDPGVATTKDDYTLESYVLGTNHYQIEMLANLDAVPEAGALVMVSFPKPQHGSGFPARVVAILP